MKTESEDDQRRYPPVAKEGWFYAAATAGLCLAGFAFSPALGAVLCLPPLFILWFFRDPRRSVTAGDGLILSPADGKVLSVKRTDGDADIGSGWVVAVFMSVFNVHINRAPISGTVTAVRHTPGRFLSAFKSQAPAENERTEMVIRSADGGVKCVQIAGLIARRIICRCAAGDRLTAGQRYGLIQFGSRVDIYLPDSYEVKVAEGDRVRGALTVIAGRKVTP